MITIALEVDSIDEDAFMIRNDHDDNIIIANVMLDGDISWSAWKPCDSSTEYWCKMEIDGTLYGRIGDEIGNVQDEIVAIACVLPEYAVEYLDIRRYGLPGMSSVVFSSFVDQVSLEQRIRYIESLGGEHRQEISYEEAMA